MSTARLAQSLQLALSDASLDSSPKHNWVEDAGGLPGYIRRIAQDLIDDGMEKSHAIATAISQCKKWAAGGKHVTPKTRAKAAAAIAEWEKKKASAHAKTAAKDVAGAAGGAGKSGKLAATARLARALELRL